MGMGRAMISAPLKGAANQVDLRLAGAEPWRIVVGTATVTLGLAYLYSLTRHRVPLTTRIKKYVFKLVRRIPAVVRKLEQEKSKIRSDLVLELQKPCLHLKDITELPDHGIEHKQIIEKTETYLDLGDMDWQGGAMSGTVYNSSKQLGELVTEVYGMAAWTNPLHPDAFPGLRQMETEVVRMACSIFKGGPESCGCVTSGGTESILLACKAYRDRARERGMKYPEILCPVSAHAAFDKAADILGINIKHVPLDQVTMRVDVRQMRRMINGNTMMLVGSAPQFAHGSIDPIPEIAQLGLKYDIPVHVDACLGGFLVPFMREAGYPVGAFDFSVPGVTSISADTHKYGFAPKGSSVIMYSCPELREYQWFSFPDWPGGIYATPTIGGSRAGGIIAACWAAMLSFGKDGYIQTTKEIIEATRDIARDLATIPGIKIIGIPEVSVVAVGSDEFNIYGLSDGMKQRGWGLNALQFPVCIHLCVTRLHTEAGVKERFCKDVREVTAAIMKDPSASEAGSAAMYGMAASIPDRSIVSELTAIYLDALYANKTNIQNGHAAITKD